MLEGKWVYKKNIIQLKYLTLKILHNFTINICIENEFSIKLCFNVMKRISLYSESINNKVNFY